MQGKDDCKEKHELFLAFPFYDQNFRLYHYSQIGVGDTGAPKETKGHYYRHSFLHRDLNIETVFSPFVFTFLFLFNLLLKLM